MEQFHILEDQLQSMQQNISKIKRLLEAVEQSNDLEIPREVFQLQKETTKYAKQVAVLFKDLSLGTNFNEMTRNRSVLRDFLNTLSDLSSLQKKIINNAVHHSIDNTDSNGRISEIDDIIISLSPLLNNDCRTLCPQFSWNANKLWPTIGVFTLGIVIIGGIAVLKSFKK